MYGQIMKRGQRRMENKTISHRCINEMCMWCADTKCKCVCHLLPTEMLIG